MAHRSQYEKFKVIFDTVFSLNDADTLGMKLINGFYTYIDNRHIETLFILLVPHFKNLFH